MMSAGKGITHSEYNKNADQEVAFLQIWIIPDRPNVEPRYDQITLDPEALRNRWHPVLGPRGKHQGLWIHQDAWFHLGDFESGQEAVYPLRDPNHGVYVFILEGSAEVAGEVLHRRDGLGVEGARSLAFRMAEPSRVLLMEVPPLG